MRNQKMKAQRVSDKVPWYRYQPLPLGRRRVQSAKEIREMARASLLMLVILTPVCLCMAVYGDDKHRPMFWALFIIMLVESLLVPCVLLPRAKQREAEKQKKQDENRWWADHAGVQGAVKTSNAADR